MPNRILREGILTSERIAKLGWAEEVFYRRLMSVVDDFGRYYATPVLIRAACYPLLIDKVSDADVGKWLAKCAEAALVSVYPAQDGKRYLQLLDFRQQARAKESKFPPMPSACVAGDSGCIADATQTLADAHLGVFVSGDVSEDEGGGRADARSPQGSRLPSDWVLPDTWAAEAKRVLGELNRQDISIPLESEKFRDFWAAQPGAKGRKTDWLGTWRNWLRKACEYQRAPANGAASKLKTPSPNEFEGLSL